MTIDSSSWAVSDYTKIPYGLYHDEKIYAEEQERVFRGNVWITVGLEAEYTRPGDYRMRYAGDTPIVIVKDDDGALRSFVNRCAHRGAEVVREACGNARNFTCIYHQWSYNKKGEAIGVPFRRGLKGVGGMPSDFDPKEHSLRALQVATYRGIIFVSFASDPEPIEEYLGPTIRKHLDEVLNRPLKVLGYQRQRVYANWKLYLENIRDAYHGSLLHEFLRVFGLSRLTQVAGGHMDERHRHSVLFQFAGSDDEEETRKAYNENLVDKGMTSLHLKDPELVRLVKEHDSGITTRVLSVFPNGVMHQIYNCMNLRQVQPKGPGEFELLWTVFGYADDSEELTALRSYQANMVGPAGLVAMEDAEALELVQKATLRENEEHSILEMAGGGAILDQETRLTEVPIRGFWAYYSQLMGIEPPGAVR